MAGFPKAPGANSAPGGLSPPGGPPPLGGFPPPGSGGHAPFPGGAYGPAGEGALFRPSAALRSARFRKGREESWKKLEDILSRLEKKGFKSLSVDEEVELPHLYRVAVSSLALARNIILDRLLLVYLENLCFRAYIAVYGPRKGIGSVFSRFVRVSFPRAARNLRWYLLCALLIFLSGFASSAILVSRDLNNFYDILPESMAPVSPADSREFIIEHEIHQQWPGFKETFVVFANFLFTHNSRVAILSFALSFLLGVPTVLIAYDNGKILGAMISLHASKDLLVPYLAWLSIHGVTEILAFLLAVSAGLSVARRVLAPGPVSRLKALSIYGREAAMVMVGVVMMLLIAAILEGGFRQLINSTPGRLVFAALTGLFWFYYFALSGGKGGGKDKGRDEPDDL